MLNGSRARALVGLLLIISPLVFGQSGSQPWDGAAFGGNARAMATAAQALAGAQEKETVILLDERKFVLDASHRVVETRRLIYRVGSTDTDDWSNVSASWRPWRQQKPVIRARVIAPDGRQSELDQKTLSTASVGDDRDTFGDLSSLRAPLPALTAGALVEKQVIIRDNEPVFVNGISSYIPIGNYVRSLQTIVTIEAPTALPLRHATQFLPGIEPRRVVSGNRVTLTFTLGPRDKIDILDLLRDSPDQPRLPYIGFSTGRSWGDVAAAFTRIVDAQIGRSNVSALVKETVGPVTDRSEIIERVLQKVQRKVRYKAVELGEAAIVPTSPAETLRLEYGDCKDQAALLIAMLRTAGIEAHMALLSVTGHDPHPDLPGFGAFDHAIVYVPGPSPIWIDSTPGYTRTGQLPLQDQNRLALIVRPGEQSLARIPESDSRSIETREVYLAELGSARIVETTEYFGAAELSIRSGYGGNAREDVEKRLQSYGKETYVAAKVEGVQFTDPADLSVPFRLQLEARDVRIALTDLSQAVVAIPIAPLLAELQEVELTPEEEKQQRSEPVTLTERWSTEVRYRIVPPAGFGKPTMPPDKEERMGPAVLSWRFSTAADGSVNGVIRFDTGKKRYSAEEASAARKGLSRMEDAEPLLVSFDQIGEEQLSDGNVREALVEFRRLAALHPDEALHRAQIARALLQGGLGEAAREEARRAVALDSKSTIAHQVLGITMEHDLVGVRFMPGWDREAALTAHRNAVETDPKESVSLMNLGVLLEHNADGQRYGKGADLEGAIAQYKLAIAEATDESHKNVLKDTMAVSLLYSQRFAEAKDIAVSATPRLTAIAATDGPDAAIREAGRITDNTARQNALIQTGATLAQLRLYGPAAAMMRAGARGSANASQILTQADRLARIRRHEEVRLSRETPADITMRSLTALFTGATDEEVLALFSKANRDSAEGLKDGRAMARAAVGAAGIANPEMIADSVLGLIELTTEGNDQTGYRVRIAAPDASMREQSAYIVREDGEYRILAISNAIDVALEALRRLDRNDPQGARQLLAWVRDDFGPVNLRTGRLSIDAFTSLWGRDGVSDTATLRLAAAALLSMSQSDAEMALSILKTAPQTITDPAILQRLDLAQASALLQLERFEESLALAQRALGDKARGSATPIVLASLTQLRRFDEARQFLERQLREGPGANPLADEIRQAIGDSFETEIQRQFASLEMEIGNIAKAEEVLRQITASRNASSGDFNNLAWISLFRGGVTESDVSAALRAATMSQNRDPGILHTVAALFAEVGKTAEARQVLLQSMSATGRSPSPADWYVFGRIYEQLGERDAAIVAYRRSVGTTQDVSPTSSAALAEKRLKELAR